MTKILILFLLITVFNINNTFAGARIRIPRDLKTKELNENQDQKFKNMYQAEDNELYKTQYKGPLKIKKPVDKTYITDFMPYMGFFFEYSQPNPVKIKEVDYTETLSLTYVTPKLNFKNNINYGASLGLYWPNGLRMEFEYTQIYHSYPKRKFLRDLGNIYTIEDYADLELKLNSFMYNIIFEKFNDRSKIVPYVGAGIGFVYSDFNNITTENKGKAAAYQLMLGLSYKMETSISLYLGYKYYATSDIEQVFVDKTMNSTGSGAGMVVNKRNLKENYQYKASNIQFGARFFF